ncbi:PilZ domain-containing protein [Kineococcus gynurae]|uniref:PilZ domain-containing protein n=1 Tax=Kineococcus gynurae TaxID=452979 RepID=A0ABV5LR26_9ACTN
MTSLRSRTRAGARDAGTESWAPLNSRVYLTLPGRAADGGDLELLSRVEDHRDDADGPCLVVAMPRFGGDLAVEAGLPVVVRWGSRRGRHRRGCRLLRITREPVPVWTLLALDDPTIEQRRRFVRVESSGRVVLALAPTEGTDASMVPLPAAEGTDPVAADDETPRPELRLHLLDISEGGARLTLDPETTAPEWLQPGEQVRFRATVGGRALEQPAEILPARFDSSTGTVVVAFLPPVQQAEFVRQHVMQVQIANRRTEGS